MFRILMWWHSAAWSAFSFDLTVATKVAQLAFANRNALQSLQLEVVLISDRQLCDLELTATTSSFTIFIPLDKVTIGLVVFLFKGYKIEIEICCCFCCLLSITQEEYLF